MAHLIIPNTNQKTEKKYKIKLPNLSGKFGFSFNLGRKEIFIGVAIANIEVETVVKQRKKKVFVPQGKAIFVNN